MRPFLVILLAYCFANFAFAQTPAPNAPPKVFVDGQSDYLSSGAFLFCSTADDGLVNSLTFFWTRISGPGTVTWGAQQKATTHARFSAKGLYVLQCAVYDGQYTVTDRITIAVDAYSDITVRP